jgi:hypothetical protein
MILGQTRVVLLWYTGGMKALIIYRPKSEFARRTEEYAHDYHTTRSQEIELVDIDSPSGIAPAELYEVVSYPTLLIIRENGELINQWQGIDSFPLMSELATYLGV